jgi:hypothetical protein
MAKLACWKNNCIYATDMGCGLSNDIPFGDIGVRG